MNNDNDQPNASQPSASATQATSDVILKEESCAHGKNTPDPINAQSRRKQSRHKRNKMGNQQPTGETDSKKKSKRKSKNKNGNRNSVTNASLSSESLKSETGHQEAASCESTETHRNNECEWLPGKTAYTTAMVKRTESLREQSQAVDTGCKPKTTGSRVVDALIIQNENFMDQDDNSTESRDMSSLGSFEILLPPIAAYDDSFENAHDDIFKDSKDTLSDDVSFTSIGEVYHSLPKHPRTDEIALPNDKGEYSDLYQSHSEMFDLERGTKVCNEPELSFNETGDYFNKDTLEETLIPDISVIRNSGISDRDLKLTADERHETGISVNHTKDNSMQLQMITTNETNAQENDIDDRDMTLNDISDLVNENSPMEPNDKTEQIDGKREKISENIHTYRKDEAYPKLDELPPLQTLSDQFVTENQGPEKDGRIYTLIETEILKQTERCESFETAPNIVYSKINQKATTECNKNYETDKVKNNVCDENDEPMENAYNIIDDILLIKEIDIPNFLQHRSPGQDIDDHDMPADHQEGDYREDSNANEPPDHQGIIFSNQQSAGRQHVDKFTNIGPHDSAHTPALPTDILDDNETVPGANNENATGVTFVGENDGMKNSDDVNQERSIKIDGKSTVSLTSEAAPMQEDGQNDEIVKEMKEDIPHEEPEVNTKASGIHLSNQTGIIDTVGVETDSKVTRSANVPKSLSLSHVPPPSPSTMVALEEGEEGSDIDDAVISTPQDHLGETLMAKLSLLELQSHYENEWQHLSSDSDDLGHSRDKIQINSNNDNEVSTNNNVNETLDRISPMTTDIIREKKLNFPSPLQRENVDLKCEPASETMDCVKDFVSCTTVEDTATESDTIYSSAGTDTVAMVESSANEETRSEMSTPTPTPSLRLPNLANTLPVMLELKQIFEDSDVQTPVAEQLPTIEPSQETKSPSESRRRSRTSPTVTDKSITESELDISEQRDDISTDSMYADDEDDFVSEVLFSKTYTEPIQGGEVLVSCTLVNTPNQDMDSDEFWAESAYRDIESSANAASSTYCNARRQMQDIHHHLQNLREQMAHLHAEIEGATLSIDIDYESDDRFAATD